VNETIDWLNEQSLQIMSYRAKVIEAFFGDLHQDYSKDASLQDAGHTCHVCSL
jgi:hypothetical protein